MNDRIRDRDSRAVAEDRYMQPDEATLRPQTVLGHDEVTALRAVSRWDGEGALGRFEDGLVGWKYCSSCRGQCWSRDWRVRSNGGGSERQGRGRREVAGEDRQEIGRASGR